MKKVLLTSLEKILAFLARIYLYRTRPYIVGITGSVGKTSCRMIISQIFDKYLTSKRVYTSPKNFNSELGLVFSIFKIEDYTPGVFSLLKLLIIIFLKAFFSRKKYDILVLEYGIDHPGDMDFLLSIAKPDISIFTKLDTIHLEYFDSKEAIGEEKMKLIHHTKGKVFLNPKDEFCRAVFSKIQGEVSYFPAVIQYELKRKNESIQSAFIYDKSLFTSNIIGEENIEYIALGCEILKEIGYTKIPKFDTLELTLQPGRFTIFPGVHKSILIDSSYNAGPESMKKMIENTYFLRDTLFPDHKIGFILGDMRELGKISKDEHKKLYTSVKNADLILSIGTETEVLHSELKKNNFPGIFKNYVHSSSAGTDLRDYLGDTKDTYILLFKGSQNTIFVEEALKQVLKNKNDGLKLVRQSQDWLNRKMKNI